MVCQAPPNVQHKIHDTKNKQAQHISIRESLEENGNQSLKFHIGEKYGRIVIHCDLLCGPHKTGLADCDYIYNIVFYIIT